MKNRLIQYPGRQVYEDTSNAGLTTVTTSANSGGSDQFTVITDYNGPRNRKVRHGHQFSKAITVNYSGFKMNTPPSGSKAWTRTSGVGIQSFTSNGLSLDPGYSSVIYNEALAKLYSQMRGEIDLSIDLIQSHQTVELCDKGVKLLKNMGTALLNIRRSNPKKWANAWLEYQYGLKPTLSTIYDSFKRVMTNEDGYFKLKSTSQQHTSYQGVVDLGGGLKRYIRQELQQRCRLLAEFNVKADRIAQLAGYTSLNPVSIVWEAIPYSFVADWFIDVGGYLRSYESACIYSPNFLGGVSVEGYLLRSYAEQRGVQDLGLGAKHIEDMQGLRYESGKRRVVLSGPPIPKMPQLNPSLGSSRLISAASLLAQRVHSWKA
jgi:hypothetical protein